MHFSYNYYMNRLSLFLCNAFFLICMLSGCTDVSKFQQLDGVIWNTTYHISFRGEKELKDSIINTLQKVDNSLNYFNDKSLLSAVNKSGDSIPVDSMFLQVYNYSVEINTTSGGMFDPTISPLISAWGFAKGHRPTSDTLKIDSLLKFTGIHRTSIRNMILYKEDPRITFNFSAIAKGFGCDCVAQMLRRNGVDDFLIEIGGEIVLSGKNETGNKWRIAIDTPVFDSICMIRDSSEIIELSDCGIATSGNYRNFHERNGNKFGHTISPLSGRPVTTDILSATIIAPNSMKADAVATAAMALGSERGLTLVNNLGYDALFILEKDIIMTPGFRKLISSSKSK